MGQIFRWRNEETHRGGRNSHFSKSKPCVRRVLWGYDARIEKKMRTQWKLRPLLVSLDASNGSQSSCADILRLSISSLYTIHNTAKFIIQLDNTNFSEHILLLEPRCNDALANGNVQTRKHTDFKAETKKIRSSCIVFSCLSG